MNGHPLTALVVCLFALTGAICAAPASQPASQADGDTLRVVTLNMLSADRASPARIAQAIGRHNPDVVFLQEVADTQADAIATTLKLNRAATARLVERQFGRGPKVDTAILCRQPLASVRILATTRANDVFPLFGLIATTRLANRPVTLICVHLRSTSPGTLAWMAARTEQRWFQTRVLFAALEGIKDPVILGGDFNEGYTSWTLQRLAPRFAHAFDKAGHGTEVTFPEFPGPLRVQIDHVFYTAPFEAKDCFVDPADISDHRMVVATLRMVRKD